MEEWKKWTIVVAGLVAAVSPWVGTEANTHYWLPVIGGVVAALTALLLE